MVGPTLLQRVARLRIPASWTPADRLSIVATLAIGLALAVAQVAGWTPVAQDASVYHRAVPGQLYIVTLASNNGAYLYSPAFADALTPLRALPLRWFAALWQLGLCIVLALTVRRWSAPLLVVGFVTIPLTFLAPLQAVSSEVALGNIEIVLAAVAVFGLRRPALWAFAPLTKVTPGVGILWFVVRGEWRNLAIALGVTAAIALVSFALVPGDWPAWIAFIRDQRPSDFPLWTVPVPLPIRVAMSAVAVAWGARTDRPWIVPIAAGWAIPVAYPTMLATMAGALAYLPLDPRGWWPALRRPSSAQ